MPSSTSSSERVPPRHRWRSVGAGALGLFVMLLALWEVRWRAAGYAPAIDDTSDLWAEQRSRLAGDATVIVGTSRALFDLDLDVLERGLGRRPLQLALVGSSAYPVLAHLADEPSFRGTVVCDVVPALLFAPAGSPPMANAQRAIDRFATWTVAQRAGLALSLPLERAFAFLQQEDLTLPAFLKRIELPGRERYAAPPKLPPYFYTLDPDRRAQMTPTVLTDAALRDRLRHGWIPLFTPPPPPASVPTDAFARAMSDAVERRFADIEAAVARIRARGGRVVFLCPPSDGPLLELEERLTPRSAFWDRLLRQTGAPGVHFADHPELKAFACPEWSHLSAEDSVEFTRRLVPHLRAATAGPS